MGVILRPEELERIRERNRSRRSPVSSPIYDPISPTVPIGITPFMRENDVNFSVVNLKPDSTANIFFDEIKVNNFCQRASYINANTSSAFTSIRVNEGIYGKTSKAYAEVLGSSITGTDNLLYLNENFISVNVAGPSLSSADFQINDFVYQNTGNSQFYFDIYSGFTQPVLAFYGRVRNWEVLTSTTGVLVIEPLSGTLETSVTNSGQNALFNQTNFIVNRAAVNLYANNRFKAGEEVVRSGTDQTLFSVTNYSALSSSVTGAGVNVYSIVLSSNNTTRDGLTDIVGNTISIVSGTNMGFKANVINIASNTLYGWTMAVVDDSLPEFCTSNSVYSIGEQKVNDVGSLYGIFHIPSYSSVRWATGERVFTVTDTASYNDNNYGMRAIAKYTALGRVDTSENARNNVLREMTPSTKRAPPKTTENTQKLDDRKFMAQTFFTPKGNAIVNNEVKNAFGIYVTSVDLFFKEKPTDNDELLPFTIGISKVENGIPANDLIASRTLDVAYINVTNNPDAANASTYTKFTFKDPVYLLPETEYAIKLITESDDYVVWTATLGGTYTDVFGNVRRISEQPYSGNFFKSQNASNWNPILNQDLMFRVNRAVFESSNTYYFNIQPTKSELNQLGTDYVSNTVYDAIKISSSGEQTKSPTSITYEVNTLKADGTSAGYLKVNNNEIYPFSKDTATSVTTRRRAIYRGNAESINVRVTMSTTDNTVSPILNYEQISAFTLQNIINNAGIANNLITITNPGNHMNAQNIAVTISMPDVGNDVATANVLPGMLSGNSLIAINITNPGSGYYSTPDIFIAEPGAPANAKATISGETESFGGNILSKYQTKIVTLEEGFDAGDLIVRLDAIKPAGTDVLVYFKIVSGKDIENFNNKKWKLMTKVRDNVSADQSKRVPLEYRYSLTKGTIEYKEGDKTYPIGGTFNQFAVKIRLVSNDPTLAPSVESLRVMAVPGG